MTSPHLAELIKNVDPVDALRLLVADLQGLADRLGLKAHSRSLQQTLKATQERVYGPRTVVMLLSESAPIKRRFLERLLGPELAAVPQPAAGCLRLEHGAEAECTVTMPQGLTAMLPLEQLPNFLARRGVEMPQQQMQTIRLPNATLGRGLAVIDTPAIGTGSEPAKCVFEAAEQADAWIFVLDSDYSLSERSLELLRRLPENATRLDIVVEGAETLSGEARLAARERLITTLREHCNIAEPRLTLLASPAAEGEEGSFWQGRFATFQSVMMLRGRERWLESTREIVAEAMAEVAAEIEFELKSASLGLRQARLRLGQKDLQGLRIRFAELAVLDSERPRETAPSLVSAVLWPEPERNAVPADAASETDASVFSGEAMASPESQTEGATTTEPNAPPLETPRAPIEEITEAIPTSTETAIGEESIPAAPMGSAIYVGFREPASVAAPAKRGVSVKLSGSLTRLLMPARGEKEGAVTMPWRLAGIALVAAFAWLILWAVWPRDRMTTREPAAQWSFEPQPADGGKSSPSSGGMNAAPAGSGADSLPAPAEADAGADTTSTETATPGATAPDTLADPTSAGAAVRTPLPRSTANALRSSRARKRRHGFLGLGRFWHWIRRDDSTRPESSER